MSDVPTLPEFTDDAAAQSVLPKSLTTNGKRIGRKEKDIDEQQVLALASIECTLEEIAAVLDCSISLLSRRFRKTIARGREMATASVKRELYKQLKAGSAQVAIHMAKARLGHRYADEDGIVQSAHIEDEAKIIHETMRDLMSDPEVFAAAQSLATKIDTRAKQVQSRVIEQQRAMLPAPKTQEQIDDERRKSDIREARERVARSTHAEGTQHECSSEAKAQSNNAAA